MNTGAFGEGFPYTNFHDLNMDWIVKIAKDFLDQYSHIQQVIADGEASLQTQTESGLTQLQEKADALEEALNAWYTEHSNDIAGELANALSDLNAWYAEHSNDIAGELADALEDIGNELSTALSTIDSRLSASISSFNSAIETKGQQTLASIPEDYTELSNEVTNISRTLYDIESITAANAPEFLNLVMDFTAGHEYIFYVEGASGGVNIADPDGHTITGSTGVGSYVTWTPSTSYEYVRIYFTDNGITVRAVDTNSFIPQMQSDISDIKNKLNTILTSNTITSSNAPEFLNLEMDFKAEHEYIFYIEGESGGVGISDPDGHSITPTALVGSYLTWTPSADYDYVRIYFTENGITVYAGDTTSLIPNLQLKVEKIPEIFNEVSYTNAESGFFNIKFHIVAGRTYKITPSGTNTIVNIYKPNGDLIAGNIASGQSYLYTATTEETGLRFYATQNNTTITIEDNTTEIAKLNTRVDKLESKVSGYITVGGSNADFSTILDAALYAKAHPNSELHIIVNGGTYDIISEFTNKYGNDYFSSMTEGEYGIPIGFGETWEFAPSAKLVCNYTGNNDNVIKSFCVFFFEQGDAKYDCKMVGLNVNATNIKYIIHDEMVTCLTPYTHEYYNCQLVINQNVISQFTTQFFSTSVIGGGLGRCGNIIIDGCYFESNPEISGVAGIASYHNTGHENAQSFIKVANCYFNGDKTFAVGTIPDPTATYNTKLIVCGNSLGQAIIGRNTPTMQLLDFNNTIR